MKKTILYYNRIKKILLFLFVFIFNSVAFSQSINDTANTPYWINMMQNRNINYFTTVKAFNKYYENRVVLPHSGYKVFKRWQEYWRTRVDKNGNFPANDALWNAYFNYFGNNTKNSNSYSFVSTSSSSNNNWKSLGPYELPDNLTSQLNGMGRINCIEFHPTDSNKIWVGTPQAGLWSSTNGGKTWTSNTDSLPTLGVSAIIVDPNNSNIIYIGTGDRDAGDSYGLGIMKSTNGGTSWKQINSGLGYVTVGMMVMNKYNSNVLIAATNDGIYKTINAGATWVQTSSNSYFYKDIKYHPTDTNIVYAESGGDFYRSADGGNTFTLITGNGTSNLPSGDRAVIGVSLAAPNLVYVILSDATYGTYKGTYLSRDKGVIFVTKSTSPNIFDRSYNGSGTATQAWYDMTTAVNIDSFGVLYVGGINVFRSADSGATWKCYAIWDGGSYYNIPEIHADQHQLRIDPKNKKLYCGNDGGLYSRNTNSAQFTDLSSGLNISQIYRIGQSAQSAEIVIAGWQDNGTGYYNSSVSGSNKWATTMGGDGMECIIDPTDSNYMYGALYYGDIRQTSYGSTLSTIIAKNGTNGINESGGWITPYILHNGDPNTMFVGYENVWRGTNIKTNPSFDKITWGFTDKVLAIEQCESDTSRMYYSRGDYSTPEFYRTDDLYQTSPSFTDMSSYLPNTYSTVNWIETDHNKPNTVYIIQDNNIYISDDKGYNWTNITDSLPAVAYNCLVMDKQAIDGIYVGTDVGVFYRDSITKTWVPYKTSLPANSRVTELEIFYDYANTTGSRISASTYGRGLWQNNVYLADSAPVADFTLDSSTCNYSIVKLTDKSTGSPDSWHWIITPASYHFVNGTNASSQSPEIQFMEYGIYKVKLYASKYGRGYGTKEVNTFVNPLPISNAGNDQTVCNLSNVSLSGYGTGTSIQNCTSNCNISSGYCTSSSSNSNDEHVFYTSISGELNGASNFSYGANYTDNTGKVFATLIAGKTYTCYVGVLTTSSYTEYVSVFFDWDRNGTFEANERIDFGSQSINGIYYFGQYVAVPSNAVAGQTLMRVINKWGSTPDSCGNYSYGETEDYTIEIKALSTSGVSYLWTGPNSFSSTSQNPTISGITGAKSGNYYLTVTNSSTGCAAADVVAINVNPIANAGKDIAACNMANITLNGSAKVLKSCTSGCAISNTYCASSGYIFYYNSIKNVSLNGATNTSYGSIYTDNTSKVFTTLLAGNTYSSSVTIHALGSYTYPWLVSVFIDWDRSGTFEANERIDYGSKYFAGDSAFTKAITVPSNVKTGQTLMRVVNTYYYLPDSCGSYTYGETEDYKIELQNVDSNIVKYSWSGPNSFASNVKNPTITALTSAKSGNYILTAKDTVSGCSATDTVAIVVNQPPSAKTGTPKSICKGNSTYIGDSAVSGNTYGWTSNPAGYTNTSANPKVNPTVTTKYYLTETITATGCTKMDSVVVTVNPIPSANAGSPKTICKGTSTSIGASGVSGNTYSWISNPNGFTDTSANPTVNPTVTTKYYLTETIAATGCTKTDSVTVTISVPSANAGTSKTICKGATTAIGASRINGNTYSWTSNPNGFTDTSANPTVKPITTTTYYLTETITATGCSKSDSVTVTVNPIPAANAGAAKSICIGASTLIGAGAVNGNSYTWKSKPVGFNDTSANPTVNPTTTTKYYLTETITATGCSKSDSVTITVNPLPAANAGAAKSICMGASTSIGATAVNGNTYSWTSNPNGFSDTTANPNVNPTTTTKYYLTEINTTTGCSKSDSVTVTVNLLPSANAGVAKTICKGASASIGASAVNGNTYAWTSNPNGFIDTSANPNVKPNITTKYYLTETNNASGCSKFDSVTVTVNPLPAANAGTAKTVCYGSSTYIGASATAGNSYSWVSTPIGFTDTSANPNVNPNMTTKYYLTETNNSTGCTNVDSVSVSVNPLPIANTGIPKTICIGGYTTIGGSAVNGNTYAWYTNPIGFNDTSANPKVNPTVTTKYYLTETISSTGCSKSDSTTVVVNPLPKVGAKASDTVVCVGSSIILNGTGAASYSWSGGVTDGVGFFPPSTSNYTVIGTDSNKCINTAIIKITVTPLPNSKFNFSHVNVSANVNFIANFNGLPAYQWDYGDGSTDTGKTASHIYNGTGSYIACLTTTNAFGCKDSSCQTININTDISKADFNNPVKIYPNPTNGIITIEYKSYIKQDVIIYNALGDAIYKDFLPPSQTQFNIDVSCFAKGIYFVRMGNQLMKVVKE